MCRRVTWIVIASFAQLAAAQPEDAHPAPEANKPGAPSESQLTPPPSAEKTELQLGTVTELLNPAFPSKVVSVVKKEEKGKLFSESDLSRYFASGTLKQAKDQFDQGRYAKARALLEKQSSDLPVRYLKALCASRMESNLLAAPEFEALAGDYPALKTHSLFFSARAYEELRRWDKAAELYRLIDAGARQYPDAQLGLARVLRRKGDLAGAIAVLVPLSTLSASIWGRDLAAEALFLLADLRHQSRAPQLEKDHLLSLYAAHPFTALAVQAGKKLRGLHYPSWVTVSRAEQYIEANRNKEGMAMLEPLLPRLEMPELWACRGQFAFGKALRKQRLHTRAIEILKTVVERCKDESLRPRALYVLGSSQSIVDLPAAANTYLTLARDYPLHTFADDALFYAADVLSKLKRADEALRPLGEIARRYGEGDFAAEAMFKTFWIYRRAHQNQLALDVLHQMENRFEKAEDNFEIERVLYWDARMLQSSGRLAPAIARMEQLAVDHPAGYYGFIAREKLKEWDKNRFEQAVPQWASSEAARNPWPLASGSLEHDRHFVAAVELYRMGFNEAVSPELLSINRVGVRGEPSQLLIYLLASAGDARSAHAVARTSLRKELGGRITGRNRFVWEIAYPNAFRPLIEKHCESAHVEPDLLQGLMREESALDPKALSWAGALGLTQLMLPTAKAVAKTLKMGRVSPALLLQPEPNIRIGSAYLGMLLRQWQGNKAYALASYNAGAGAVKHWRENNPKAELDEWVEEIPIAETRGYVKRVLRSYNTYQLLNGTQVRVHAAER